MTNRAARRDVDLLLPGQGPASGCFRRQAMAAILSCCGGLSAAEPAMRLGLSESLARDVNATDARAAISYWIRNLVAGMNIQVQLDEGLFSNASQLEARLKGGEIDAVGVNILEYRRMTSLLDRSQVTVPVFRTRFEYVLLVRADGPLTTLPALRGRRLLLLDSLAACVAPAWLSNLVGGEAHDPAQFFSEIVRRSKPSQVILPVFFGQADACLTTQPSFSTMGELNPQVVRRLRPLAVSPEIVHSLYAFRKGWTNPTRDKVVQAFANMGATATGRQVLTMFQCDSLSTRDAHCLDSSLAILAQADRAAGGKAVSG